MSQKMTQNIGDMAPLTSPGLTAYKNYTLP